MFRLYLFVPFSSSVFFVSFVCFLFNLGLSHSYFTVIAIQFSSSSHGKVIVSRNVAFYLFAGGFQRLSRFQCWSNYDKVLSSCFLFLSHQRKDRKNTNKCFRNCLFTNTIERQSTSRTLYFEYWRNGSLKTDRPIASSIYFGTSRIAQSAEIKKKKWNNVGTKSKWIKVKNHLKCAHRGVFEWQRRAKRKKSTSICIASVIR